MQQMLREKDRKGGNMMALIENRVLIRRNGSLERLVKKIVELFEVIRSKHKMQ